MAHKPGLALAHDRQYDEVIDRDTGMPVSLAQFLGNDSYGEVIERKRVALENDLVQGRVRFICPHCEQAMVLRSVLTRDKSEERFYFRHRIDDGACTGTKGLSPAAICARKFEHAQEGAQHKLFKRLIEQSIAADARFSQTRTEARWKDVDGVRWRQPDVQSVFHGRRVAFEVQLSTTFLHVIAERMSFYRRNDGALLWLFRDLDPEAFRLAEDDIFYSNNRNAFRVGLDTLAQSVQQGRFMLDCAWHQPEFDGQGVLHDQRVSRWVGFDELTFDVSPAGVPRAYFYDYDGERAAARQRHEQACQEAACAHDQALRDAMEQVMLTFSMEHDGNVHWQALRQRFKARGFNLPYYLYGDQGPFYLLQAAYSAKHGQPVACGLKNLMGLANSLFSRHKDVLWVWVVMLGHYARAKELAAHGNVEGWKKKRNQYREGWFRGEDAFAPNRSHDDLLAFLFPEAAEKLRQSPGLHERLRRQRGSTTSAA